MSEKSKVNPFLTKIIWYFLVFLSTENLREKQQIAKLGKLIMICKAPTESAYDIVVDAMNEKERSYSWDQFYDKV